jgi:hypothetical protein
VGTPLASHASTGAAVALGVTGLTMNAMFGHSLGATDAAQWLFVGVGMASDCAALVLPSSAAAAWQARQRGTAAAGWIVFGVTLAFAVMSAIGFTALNVTDTTSARAARVTPAVTTAKAALADAVTSRDRECKGGVGKFCRQREETVTARQAALDSAMTAVASADDFGMVRLLLLALLPQLGGVLLMIGRTQ